MKLDLFDIAEFIKVNHLQEVTSPIGLASDKMPNPNGIFSYEIFGYTTEERKNTFAYIDLRGVYFHPQCVKTLSRMGILGKILSGDKYAIIVDKKIHPINKDEIANYPGASTGTSFFYDNWENINWNAASILTKDTVESDDELSIDKKNRIKLFRYLKKNEAFCRYWLVLPPYYRDFNTNNDTTLGDDINKVYKELILKTMALKKGFADEFGFSSVGAMTKARIQDLLGILYDIGLGPVTGKSVDINTKELKGNAKRSIVRRNLIGRFLDFAASSVITSPVSSATETPADFAHFGEVQLPLQSFMAMYKPFFLNYCTEFLDRTMDEMIDSVPEIKRAKNFDRTQWSLENVDKSITRFIKTASEKDIPISYEMTDEDGDKSDVYIMMIINDSMRPMTYLDLFYQAALEIAKDKYSLNTRYPLANNQNIYPAKIKVMSTLHTYKATICKNVYSSQPAVEVFEHYPYIRYDNISKYSDALKKFEDKNPKPSSYYDMCRATVIGNGHIASLNADYDGDCMFFRGLFTKEANAEAERMVWQKSNFFGADGKLSRGLTGVGTDCLIALYELTSE